MARAPTRRASSSRARCVRPSTAPPGRCCPPSGSPSAAARTTPSARGGGPRAGRSAESAEPTVVPLSDPAFNREQSTQVHALFEERMRALDPHDFAEMMRSAMREDEGLLLLHGAVLGIVGGLAHVAVFG